MQFRGLTRDHKQQYSFNLDNLVFKWKQAHGQQNTPIPPNHIKEECLLVRRLQDRKVNPLTKYIRFFKWGKKTGSLPFSFLFYFLLSLNATCED